MFICKTTMSNVSRLTYIAHYPFFYQLNDVAVHTKEKPIVEIGFSNLRLIIFCCQPFGIEPAIIISLERI